ncbi:hypothetical protein KDA08_05810 [Candidatus Saccharibacteria bacterium]|nr:hypothetical protein [Candidatus Saccharibacteria bacterium]
MTNTTTTGELIAKLKTAHEQSTQGEWVVIFDPHENGWINLEIMSGKEFITNTDTDQSEIDKEAICTLRNNLPTIIAELEKVEGLVAALEKISERDSEDRKYELEIYQQFAQEALANYHQS